MKRRLFLIPLLAVLIPGCGEKPETAASATNSTSSGNPITAPVDYLGAVNAAHKQAATVVDVTTLQKAVQAFQAGEERLPGSLQELVSEGYLPRLPDVPRGFRFDYNPQNGQVRVVPAAATGR